MPRYEYKVVPAPTKGRKGKGIKGAEARFSHALQELMNGLSGYGWEYQRAETLPSVERSGLTSTTTEWRNVLVFRRLRENDASVFAPELLPAPTAPPPEVRAVVQAPAPAADVAKSDAVPDPDQSPAPPDSGTATAVENAEQPWDNGIEDTSDVQGVGASLEKLAAARNTLKTSD